MTFKIKGTKGVINSIKTEIASMPKKNMYLKTLLMLLQQHSGRPSSWDLHRPQWSARIELEMEDLRVSWQQDGQSRVRHFPYGLSRADVEAAILAGP